MPGASLTVKIDSGYPDVGQVALTAITIYRWQLAQGKLLILLICSPIRTPAAPVST